MGKMECCMNTLGQLKARGEISSDGDIEAVLLNLYLHANRIALPRSGVQGAGGNPYPVTREGWGLEPLDGFRHPYPKFRNHLCPAQPPRSRADSN